MVNTLAVNQDQYVYSINFYREINIDNLLKLVNAEINHVIGDTVSAFFARIIANNWIILLETEIGVHSG